MAGSVVYMGQVPVDRPCTSWNNSRHLRHFSVLRKMDNQPFPTGLPAFLCSKGRICATQVQPQEHVMSTMNHAAQANTTSCMYRYACLPLHTHLLAQPGCHAILTHDFLDKGKYIHPESLPDLHRWMPVCVCDSTTYHPHHAGTGTKDTAIKLHVSQNYMCQLQRT